MAICYKHHFRQLVEAKADVSSRIAVIHLFRNPIVIIGLYLNCRGGTKSESQYRETLETLPKILLKYNLNNDFLIAGDWNASVLHKIPTRRYIQHVKFLHERGLQKPSNLSKKMIFHHSKGKHYLQIHLIL